MLMKEDIGAFKSLKKLHTSLLTGQSIFAIITLLVAGKEPYHIEDETFSRIIQVVATVFSMAAIFIGFNLFKRSIVRIRLRNSPGVKRMEQYRRACITWWIFIVVPAFFAAICYAWTDNLSFFFLSCLHILILLLFSPRKENIILLLNLNSDDISQLEKKR
jgi:hypothetical protein